MYYLWLIIKFAAQFRQSDLRPLIVLLVGSHIFDPGEHLLVVGNETAQIPLPAGLVLSEVFVPHAERRLFLLRPILLSDDRVVYEGLHTRRAFVPSYISLAKDVLIDEG